MIEEAASRQDAQVPRPGATGSGDGAGGDAPLTFFALVFALSVPFWALGAILGGELMPGLPVASVMVVAPALAALLLRFARSGPAGAGALLARAGDARRLAPARLVAVLVLANPVLFAAAFAVQRALREPVPPPSIALSSVIGLFALFLVAAVCEELGWTGYALEPLQRRWGSVRAGLTIGAVWAAWHVAALVEAGRAVDWIAWWALWTVAARLVMVWFYNHAGRSVFGAVLFHALSNLSWQVYPVRGSFFDPRIFALVTLGAAVILIRPWRRGS